FILPGGSIELVEVVFHTTIPATTIAGVEALDDFKVISLTRGGTTTFPKGNDVLAEGDQLLVALHVSDLPKVSTIFHLDER
ncbi:MAG: TrkA C-terminal domain-containing protein, partial [Candidatus Cryosericum sp.]